MKAERFADRINAGVYPLLARASVTIKNKKTPAVEPVIPVKGADFDGSMRYTIELYLYYHKKNAPTIRHKTQHEICT